MAYTFTIKKNKLNISLTSENKEFIASEFAKFAVEFVEKPKSLKNNLSLNKNKVAQEKIIENENFNKNTSTTLPSKAQGLPANFASILAAKSKEENNVIEKKVSELKNTYLQMQNAIREKSLKTQVDYIVAAAYCLTRYEGLMRFNEEQIKAKVAPFFDEELEHNFILDAVAKNFIKILPDFTGFSDTIEFELTSQGEEYFLNEL